jgi:hypothetical protein
LEADRGFGVEIAAHPRPLPRLTVPIRELRLIDADH